MDKLKLSGFNNLTKSLCFNMYDVAYSDSSEGQREYLQYIDREYNSKRLSEILTNCVGIVGAHVLNVASQDYEPHGSSVTMLVCEDPMTEALKSKSETVVMHLDKSHICVHTYPEMHPSNGVSTFRVDIELSTCGDITPLKSLNYLLDCFDADVVNIDYTIRGFARDEQGDRHWSDHPISSICDFIDVETLHSYRVRNMCHGQLRTYNTRLCKKLESTVLPINAEVLDIFNC